MNVEESWAYRAAPKDLGAEVRRVEIVRVSGSGRSDRVHIRFVDGDEAGLQEWVAMGCLLAPWEDVEAFRADDQAELALADVSREVRGSVEFEAARMVLGFVRPKSRLRLRRTVADAGVLDLGPVKDAARIVGMEPDEFREDPMLHQDRDGRCLAGWPLTERIARNVAKHRADEILPEVDRKQQSIDEERTQPVWGSWRRDDRKLDADAAVLRTVREWCGEEKAERYDELVALREEVTRLGKVVERALEELRRRGHGVTRLHH
ncbi:PE-PGRS family protein [Streptomyces sp. NBC_01775]|uniref:PE-PGRS family protein n=1 Tax=Streptomyces sp. NBC_01775 TaxID=2975939 RepID=UPI002DD7DD19|nr:PE-PGRS family protein [Streptomyces sp. NBC_01775]WSB75787.1 PE-PGRS family protein [Streptomyces sp. NBC_01775]